MKGRTPKPTNLKLVQGNPGKRAINKNEPDPDLLNDLSPPSWLPAHARAVWLELAPKLRAARVLTVIDIEAFAMGCVSIADFRIASQKAGADLIKARLVENQEGDVVEAGEQINPWKLVASMSLKQCHKIFEQFGMTPAARTRIAVQLQGDLFGNEPKDPAKKYFD